MTGIACNREEINGIGGECPVLSVVVPIYNAEPYLEKCLNTIVNQTFSDFELICVDDASSDNSREIILEFKRRDSRIITILCDRASGSGAHPRNLGLNAAKGKYIIFLDADDYFDLTLFEKMVSKADLCNADIVLCDSYNVLFDDNSLSTKYTELHYDYIPIMDDLNQTFSYRDIPDKIYQIANSAVWHRLYRKAILTENGISFQERTPILDDVYFVEISLVVAKAIAVVAERLVYYRRGRPAAQTGAVEKNLSSIFLSFFKTNQWLIKKGIYNEVRSSLQIWTLEMTKWWLSCVHNEKKIKELLSLYRELYFPRLKLCGNDLDASVSLYWRDYRDNVMMNHYYPTEWDMFRDFHRLLLKMRRVIVYGAGKNALKQLPILLKCMNVQEVWDKNVALKDICGIPVVSPRDGEDENIPIIITVGNDRLNTEIKYELKQLGYRNFFRGIEIIPICRQLPDFLWKAKDLTNYIFIRNPHPMVNYAVVDRTQGNNVEIKINIDKHELYMLINRTICINKERMKIEIDYFAEGINKRNENFYILYENFLRNILCQKTRTHHSVHMDGQNPYDDFANFELQSTVLGFCCKSVHDKLMLVNELSLISSCTSILRVIKIKTLIEIGKIEEALFLSREMLKDASTDLFLNEMLGEVQLLCIEKGKE